MKEVWKLTQYPNYAVSNLGRVRSYDKVLSACPNSRGYLTVRLYYHGPRTEYVHVLVAWAFLGAKPEGHQVNHKDGKKINNIPENLEYVTCLRNHQHAKELGLKARGMRHGSYLHPEAWRRHSKLTTDKVKRLRVLASQGWSSSKLGNEFGITRGHALRIIKNARWVERKETP